MFLQVLAHPGSHRQNLESHKMVECVYVCVCVCARMCVCVCIRWLIVCIFKMTKPICMIFATTQHSFVLNTSVNCILNKLITPAAPPSDEMKNSVFYLQNQARPLHFTAHVFKMPASICTVFGTIEHYDIVNMPVTSLLSTA